MLKQRRVKHEARTAAEGWRTTSVSEPPLIFSMLPNKDSQESFSRPLSSSPPFSPSQNTASQMLCKHLGRYLTTTQCWPQGQAACGHRQVPAWPASPCLALQCRRCQWPVLLRWLFFKLHLQPHIFHSLVSSTCSTSHFYAAFLGARRLESVLTLN